jgi:putative two-component system response regulator
MEGAKGKILIVDDEAFIRKLLRQKLAKEFYECDEADSADNALIKIKANTSDLVISDIIMPEKSGIELLYQIKSTYPDTAVIMATAVTEMNTAVECLKKGADDYVCKPFDLEQVSSSVQRALEKRKLQLTLKEYQNRLEEKIENQTQAIRKLSLGAIEALVIALEAKDKYTAGHSRRVTDISIAICQEMKLSGPELEDIRWGSLLHDVGKIAVNQMILNKPGDLNKEEYEHVMIHAHVGAGIVKPVVNDNVVQIIEHHHDHYDGSGLNQDLAGKSIPLGARILAVADAFDAMTSERPYRQALSVEYSLEEIRKHSGLQFDPEIAAVFLRLHNPRKVE